MHIAFVIHSLSSGGAERVTANLANHWAEIGWQVTVVTLAPQTLDFYKLHPAVRRIALGVAGESSNAISAIVNNLKRVTALRRVLHQIRPDIAVGMMTTANVLISLAAMGLPRIKVIGSERIHPPMLPLGPLWERLRSWTYPFAARITMLTSEGLNWLGHEIPRARGVLMPNPILHPVKVAEPVFLPETWVMPNRKLLLGAGRLNEQKGFDSLLNAFALLAKENPDWDLVILGEGPLKGALEAHRTVLGLDGRVQFPGRVGNVGDWYERADLYVMSSRFEGFPNTLGEAMAYGCAVVSYDCDTGPRDLIRNGEDGLLVRPVGDVPALAGALRKLMQDDALRTKLATNAIEVRNRYSIETISAMWERLFAEVKA